MKSLRTYRLLDLASIVIIILVMFIISMFLYIRFWPVDVIKNSTWVLCTAPIQEGKCKTGVPKYRVGQTITVNVNSEKLRNVGGWFTTTAECKSKSGVFVSYPISEQHSNRPKGHVQTAIDTQISNKIPNLPTTCRIAYIIEYSVYSFRSFSEYNYSNEFILLPPTMPEPQAPVSNVTIFSSIAQAPTPKPVTPVASLAPVSQSPAASQPSNQSSTTTSPTSTPPPEPPKPVCTINLLGLHLVCRQE